MSRRNPTASLAAFVAALSVAAPAFAGFGAVAYDQATGKYGLSINKETQREAEESAMHDCGEGCKLRFAIKPKMCGALATSDDHKAWGGSLRPTNDAAKLAAVQDCQKHTAGQCTVRIGECNK